MADGTIIRARRIILEIDIQNERFDITISFSLRYERQTFTLKHSNLETK